MLVTIVGNGIDDFVRSVFKELTVNSIKEINRGSLGNFATLTYEIEIDDDFVISQRKLFMTRISDASTRLVGLYEHGNWMHIYVFKRSAFK